VASAQAKGQIDLTPEHRFSLTDQSKAVLSQVKAPIHIIGFTQPGSAQQVEMRSLLRRYQLVKGDLSFEFIDPDAQPGRVQLLGDFAKAQGRLVVLADSSVLASAPDVIGQLNDLIRPWGLALRPSVIRDRSSIINDPASVLVFKYPSQSPVTVDLKAQTIPTLLVGALPVESVGIGPEKADSAWLTPLLQTSSQSSLADGSKGPFVAGALTDW